MTTINDIWSAYDEAAGRWTGCNWPTHFGSIGLNLDGVSSSQAGEIASWWWAIAENTRSCQDVTVCEEASLVALALSVGLQEAVIRRGSEEQYGATVCGSPVRCFCAGAVAREWEAAAFWLREIESDAAYAEAEAEQAVRAAEDGNWAHAIGHAHQARLIEAGYDAPRPWTHLDRVIETAAK